MVSKSKATFEVLESFIDSNILRYEERAADFDIMDTNFSGMSRVISEYPEYVVNKEIKDLLSQYAHIGYNNEEKIAELTSFILKKVEHWNNPASSDPIHNVLETLYHSAYTKLVPLIRI